MSESPINAPTIEVLPGGMRLLLQPSTINDIVATAVFIPLPGAIVSPSEAGLVSFLHSMLLRGTTSLAAAELNEAIESLGMNIGSAASTDFSAASLVCTADTFATGVSLLGDVLLNPSFEPEEIEKERQSTLAHLRASDDDKFSVTLRRLAREMYGDHGYGMPSAGYPENVREFRREQLVELHQLAITPSNMLAVCFGNFSPDEARELFAQHFPVRTHGAEPLAISPPHHIAPSHVHVDRTAEQAFVAIGFPTAPVTSPDHAALRVLGGVLGEGMSSRFFTDLRDKQGLAYATGCFTSSMVHAGSLTGYIGTKPESRETARDGMLRIFEEIRHTPVSHEELERTRNYIIGKFLIDHQTNLRRANYLGQYETMGLGLGYDEKFPEKIRAITAEQVLDVAQRYLTHPTVVELSPTDPTDELPLPVAP